MSSNWQIVTLISIIAVTIISLTIMQCKHVSFKGEDEIIWPGSETFNEVSRSFKISPEKARDLLYDKTRKMEGKKSYYYNSLLFIVNDEYFFSEPHKEKTQFEGFYVNGNTGLIRYKKSSLVTTKKLRYLPNDAYGEVEIIE